MTRIKSMPMMKTIDVSSYYALLLLGVMLCLCSWSTTASFVPPQPPLQSDVQAEVWQNANAIAQQASSAATGELLTYLDTPEFRAQIANLTMFANATAQDLLNELRSIVLQSRMQHNFPAVTFGFALDVNLTDMINNGFVPNIYTAAIEGLLPSTVLSDAEDEAEVHIMGFPEFANKTNPTLAEALNRPQYLCINAYRVAGGCIGFGQISLVLHSFMQNYSLISAVDTGLYAMCCLNTSLESSPKRHALATPTQCSNPLFTMNCSAWNQAIATYEHFDHIFLANANAWGLDLGEMIIRQYVPNDLLFAESGLRGFLATYLGYFEGDLAASILFPQSVQYVQAAVALVFGTKQGFQARNWTMSSGWPLAWAMGIDTLATNQSQPNNTAAMSNASPVPPEYLELDVNTLILDPFGIVGNLSVTDDDLIAAQKQYLMQWGTVEDFLAENPAQYFNGTYWVTVWQSFSQAMPDFLFITLPTGECALLPNCFAATKSTGQCICL